MGHWNLRSSETLLTFATVLLALWIPAFGQPQEEATDYYRKWLQEDVVYIITDAEREVFLKLQTDAERDHFIEQFWRRRDPTPNDSINEFKEEHYRRLQYANERFTAGIPGWKTDRGMVYIKYGPPDDIQDYPAGSTYIRPRHEGGGTTLVHPFQVWRYNHLQGVGSEVEIEFVDKHGGNLYRFARDELDKDALLAHPIGLTLSEELTGGDKTERIVTRHFGDLDEKLRNQIGRTPRARDEPFERLRILKELEAPPAIQYQDLRSIVTTQVHYSSLPFLVSLAQLALDEQRGLIPVTISVPDAELTFQPLQGDTRRARVEIYGRVSTLTNRVVREFEETLVRDVLGPPSGGTSVAQKKLVLAPGRYKLSLVVRDAHSGKIGTGDFGLPVGQAEGRLSTSTLILAERISKNPAETQDPLVLSGGYKVIPNLHGVYRVGQDLQLYLELYNFGLDQSSQLPALSADVRILRNGQDWSGESEVLEKSSNYFELLSDRLLILKKIPLAGLEPGDYQIQLVFRDQIRNESAQVTADFRVIP